MKVGVKVIMLSKNKLPKLRSKLSKKENRKNNIACILFADDFTMPQKCREEIRKLFTSTLKEI